MNYTQDKLAILGSVVYSSLCNVLIILLLANTLSLSDYGLVALARALLTILSPVFALGLSRAFVILRWDASVDTKELFCSTYRTLFISSIIYALILPLALSSLLGLTLSVPLVAATTILALSYNINNEKQNIFRVESQVFSYLRLSVFRGSCQVLFILLFLILNKSLLSYFYGLALSEMIITLLFSSKDLSKALKDKHEYRLTFQMLWIGFSDIFVIVGFYASNFADRFLLENLTNDNALVALYDTGYLVGSFSLALFARAANTYIQPRFTNIFKLSGAKKAFAHLLNFQKSLVLGTLGITTLSIIFSPLALQIFFPPEYKWSNNVVPLVALSFAIQALSLPSITTLNYFKHTNKVALMTWWALILNIVLNYYLIPLHGALGAAVATLISYTSMLSLLLLATRQSIRGNWAILIIAIFITSYTTFSVLTN